MATSSGKYIGIDVSKDRLDVALLGDEGVWPVENTLQGIADLVQQMQAIGPELIVVEATGGYHRHVAEALLMFFSLFSI